MKNLQQQIHTPLSPKQKTFSEIFIAFLKCAWKLEHFQKKDEFLALLFPKLLKLKAVGT